MCVHVYMCVSDACLCMYIIRSAAYVISYYCVRWK